MVSAAPRARGGPARTRGLRSATRASRPPPSPPSIRSSSGSPPTSGWRRCSRCSSGGASSASWPPTRARPCGLAIVAGLLFGIAILARETVLYFLPLAARWLAWRRPGGRPRGAAFLLVAVPHRGPWTLRNWVVYGAFVPVSTAGALEPLAGQRAALASGGLRPVLGRARPYREVPLRPREGARGHSRPTARVDLREAAPRRCRCSGRRTARLSSTSSGAPMDRVRKRSRWRRSSSSSSPSSRASSASSSASPRSRSPAVPCSW